MPNGDEAVYSIAVREHQLHWFRPPAPLQELNANATYGVFDRHNNAIYTASGYELMTLGIPGDTGQGMNYSHTLYVKQI